jgi:hypothetical protein
MGTIAVLVANVKLNSVLRSHNCRLIARCQKESWFMSDSFWFLKPEFGLLTFGTFLLLLAVVYTYTGKAWIRFHGWVNRADEPKRHWSEVAMYYLFGIGFIGLFLYPCVRFTRSQTELIFSMGGGLHSARLEGRTSLLISSLKVELCSSQFSSGRRDRTIHNSNLICIYPEGNR